MNSCIWVDEKTYENILNNIKKNNIVKIEAKGKEEFYIKLVQRDEVDKYE